MLAGAETTGAVVHAVAVIPLAVGSVIVDFICASALHPGDTIEPGRPAVRYLGHGE